MAATTDYIISRATTAQGVFPDDGVPTAVVGKLESIPQEYFYAYGKSTTGVLGPTPSDLYQHLEHARYQRILRAVLTALARVVNTDNIEAWWEPPWRLVGEWLGFYDEAEVVGQKRIWINQYRVVPFNPAHTIAAPSGDHTKMEIPDLTSGFHMFLEVNGKSYRWFHVFGFEELKRALSRQEWETINGVPVTPSAMMRLLRKIQEAARQGERQAALHFKELHRRLKKDPHVLAGLPKRYYVLATSGPWFAVGAGQDTHPLLVENLLASVEEFEAPEDIVEDELEAAEPARPLQEPTWPLPMRSFPFESSLGLTWLPHMYHINTREGWEKLESVRAYIKAEIDALSLPVNNWSLPIIVPQP
ncbi:hypothetical protein C8R47DRAFT_1132909 [Mycena vitilis]|nr:hypothetical protein C8R47DRAFT_1132909 [Mycena vitilis]